MKIYINEASVDGNVIHHIDQSISSLNEALTAANSLNSPNFPGSADITRMINDIERLRNECTNTNSWLRDSISVLKGSSGRITNTSNSFRHNPANKHISSVKI